MWIVVAIGTVQRSITGKMFFAPCLGTDLFLRTNELDKFAAKMSKEAV
jgi:hypothetical protein